MKVIHSVGVKLAGGGFGNTAYHAVRAAYRHGILHRVIALGAEKTDIPEGKIVRIPYPLPLRALGKVLRPSLFYLLKDLYFDLLASRYIEDCDIFHGWPNMMTHSAEKARRLGARVVVIGSSSHPANQARLLEEEYARYGVRLQPMNPTSFRRISADLAGADRIFAASAFVYQSMIENGVDEGRLSLMPFGVDTRLFRPREWEKGPFRALFVGQVCLRKGVQYLLPAWAELGLKDAELILAGPIGSDARQLVREFRKRRGIEFLGMVRNPAELYRQASIFVFPSIEEGSALSTYEAMASGLPLVVSQNAGSIARDGVDGFVVPIRDVDALKEKILYCYENADARRQMGRSARREVEEYTWERYEDRLADAYQRTIAASA